MDQSQEQIYNSVYDLVGNTPLVRLQKVPKLYGIECEVLVKCEFFNPSGSMKDRIAKKMIEDAEEEGRIKPGDTLVEASSGNTGIAFSALAACKGYDMIITLPDRMSKEKEYVMKSLGAQVIRTPTVATHDDESYYMKAKELQNENENYHHLDQYSNNGNADSHEATGEEIYSQCGGKLNYVFIGTGTGGTITGAARALKRKDSSIQVIGIDPYGSTMAQPESLNSVKKGYQVEGIGHDYIPDSLDRSVVDSWVKIEDKESFEVARKLISEEGLLVGGSCGASVHGCFKWLKEKGFDKDPNVRVVCLLADSIRNYLTKFVSDEWMVQQGFLNPEALNQRDHPLFGKTTADLEVKPIPHFDDRFTIDNALDAFNDGVAAIPIMENGEIKGIVTRDSLLDSVSKKHLENNNSASKAITKDVVVIDYSTDLTAINKLLGLTETVFVQKKNEDSKVEKLYGVTKLNLIKLYRKLTKELL